MTAWRVPAAGQPSCERQLRVRLDQQGGVSPEGLGLKGFGPHGPGLPAQTGAGRLAAPPVGAGEVVLLPDRLGWDAEDAAGVVPQRPAQRTWVEVAARTVSRWHRCCGKSACGSTGPAALRRPSSGAAVWLQGTEGGADDGGFLVHLGSPRASSAASCSVSSRPASRSARAFFQKR